MDFPNCYRMPQSCLFLEQFWAIRCFSYSSVASKAAEKIREKMQSCVCGFGDKSDFVCCGVCSQFTKCTVGPRNVWRLDFLFIGYFVLMLFLEICWIPEKVFLKFFNYLINCPEQWLEKICVIINKDKVSNFLALTYSKLWQVNIKKILKIVTAQRLCQK